MTVMIRANAPVYVPQIPKHAPHNNGAETEMPHAVVLHRNMRHQMSTQKRRHSQLV